MRKVAFYFAKFFHPRRMRAEKVSVRWIAAARPCSVNILHAIHDERKRGPRDGDPQGVRRREVIHCRYPLELCDQVFIPTSAAAIKVD